MGPDLDKVVSKHKEALRRLGVVLLLASTGLAAGGSDTRVAEAVKDRDRSAVAALLDQHADVNTPLADGTTALHWAVYWSELSTANLLIQSGANVNAANRYGATTLWMACTEGNAAIVEMLLQAGANPNLSALGGEPVLMSAARAGSVDAVKALLAHGADVNAMESRHGQTALMWAVGGRDQHPEVVQALLEHGAAVNVRSRGGFTPLLFAARQGDVAATKLLVEAGGNVNEKAVLPDGQRPAILGSSNWTMPSADTSSVLTMAIGNGHHELATFLLKSGANPNAASEPYPYRLRPSVSISGEALKPGFTPLHALIYRRAQSRGSDEEDRSLALMTVLIAHGADPNERLPSVTAPVPLQPSPQPVISFVELGGVTPFWSAANTLDIDAMRLLVANGADPGLTSMENTTPLMVAAGLGYSTRGPSGGLGRRGRVNAEGVEALKLLLEWGGDVNAVNDHGQTALHGAAFAAAHVAVQFLVDNGARTDLKDAIGRRPLEVADDNTKDEYRPSLQNHNPIDIDRTWSLLRQLTGETGVEQP